jgi:hypothetical protein
MDAEQDVAYRWFQRVCRHPVGQWTMLCLALLPTVLVLGMVAIGYANGLDMEAMDESDISLIVALQLFAVAVYAAHVMSNPKLAGQSHGGQLWRLVMWMPIEMVSYWRTHIWTAGLRL